MATVEIRNNVIVGIPHAFIVLTDSNGTEHGYGFYPSDIGSPNSAGKINDDTGHPYTSNSDPVELTNDQYNRLQQYIQNSTLNPPPYAIAFDSMCTTWAINGLIYAAGSAQLPAYPELNPNGFWHDIKETLLWNPYFMEITINVNKNWINTVTPPRRDPLAIDLDGDGIETIGIPATGNPILFDHDADGVKTGTGWVQPDDAWLVLDRNANGSIDNGGELFGVDTFITVTEASPGTGTLQTVTRKAFTGFEALTALDTGNGTAGSAGYGDHVFNASDAQFANVKVWQDLNQDGVSQSNELFTLAQKGIASISLAASTTATNLGNGNTVTGQATVTRNNGSTTQIDSVDMSASNLTLADNPFYREFSDTVPITSAAAALPDMGGSGWTRDLREARKPRSQA